MTFGMWQAQHPRWLVSLLVGDDVRPAILRATDGRHKVVMTGLRFGEVVTEFMRQVPLYEG